MRVVEKGYKVLYMDRAVVFEEANDHDKAEFRRHVRDGAGHYRAIPVLWRLLNPLRFKAFFLYISHRLIRWITPFLLAFLLMGSLFYTSQSVAINIFRYLFLAFSFLAASGALFRKVKVLYMPFYFCYINIALFWGFFWNFTHAKKVSWDTNRK